MANGVLGLVVGVITTLVVDMAFLVQVFKSQLTIAYVVWGRNFGGIYVKYELEFPSELLIYN